MRAPTPAAARDPAYDELRRAWLDTLVMQVQAQRRHPFATPIEHYTVCIEPDRHRDPDGVYAGAMKLVWDALTPAKKGKPGAGLIPDDTGKHVGRSRGWDVLYAHPAASGVYLKIYERDARPGDSVGLLFHGRLPDLNELFHASRVGAAREMRARR
jgi:hypothetical protein